MIAEVLSMPREGLKIAKDLILPLDAVTQTFLIVGKRGSGKSNTAARIVEQLHHARIPFVVLDPVDTWWGLKAGRDGKRGLDVYVFGGAKADLPLEAGGGALIAEVLCEHRASMVLSVKHLSGRERSTFMVQFARTLFQKWTGGPLHLVLEEAHEFAPQSAQNAREGEQEMLGAFKRLWKLGRASGIGGSAVTQRPASLSKDITTQSEILIAHRTIGPQDVAAVGQWVKYHGERLDMLADLPSLPTGQAFVWAPEFPEGRPIGLQRTSILLRDTFDSASTPKVGEQRLEPKELAAVDLERLRTKMASTIERAKADDPRELRKQIAELRKQLVSEQGKVAPRQVTVERVEVPVLSADDRAAIGRLTSDATALAVKAEQYATQIRSCAMDIKERVARVGQAQAVSHQPKTRTPSPEPRATSAPHSAPSTARDSRPTVAPLGDLTGPEVRILNAIAWLDGLGIESPEQVAVAFLAGYTFGGGAFNNPRGALRTKGLIEYVGSERVRLTDTGRHMAHFPNEALSSEELQARVLDRLPGPERRLLEPLLKVYPKALSNEELAAKAGYTPNAGAYNNPRGRLRSLGLVEYPQPGHVVAKSLLFLE